MYSSNAIQQMRQHLVKQHPLTDFFYLYVMLNQEKNNNTGTNNSNACNTSHNSYCFDVEAVNAFFSKEISTKAFAKMLRKLNYEIALILLKYPEEIYEELEETIPNLNTFAEVIDPYLTLEN